MTILTNKNASLQSPVQGTVRVPILISEDFPFFQVRIIVEDVDTFHSNSRTGMDRDYYFGKTLTEDFFKPVETFLIWEKERGVMHWLKSLFLGT